MKAQGQNEDSVTKTQNLNNIALYKPRRKRAVDMVHVPVFRRPNLTTKPALIGTTNWPDPHNKKTRIKLMYC